MPKEYPWSNYVEKRVEKVLNYVATFDWVVAIFPNFLHRFQRDLGSAGHDGFIAQHSQVANIKYIKGDHGAALSEYNWDAIAKFIVEDSPDLTNLEALQPRQIFKYSRGKWGEGKFLETVLEKCLEVIGKFPLIIWGIIIILLGLIGAYILIWSCWGEWEKTVIFMLYLGGIWTVLTRI